MNEKKTFVGYEIMPTCEDSAGCAMLTYSWANGTMSRASTHKVGSIKIGNSYIPNRMYLTFSMPTLPNNPRIRKAELKFNVASITNSAATNLAVGIFHVTECGTEPTS